MLISPYHDQEGNKIGSVSGTRAISTTSRRELSSFFLQGKAPKEIHAILTETLACFLPGRAKDLSAHRIFTLAKMKGSVVILGSQRGVREQNSLRNTVTYFGFKYNLSEHINLQVITKH